MEITNLDHWEELRQKVEDVLEQNESIERHINRLEGIVDGLQERKQQLTLPPSKLPKRNLVKAAFKSLLTVSSMDGLIEGQLQAVDEPIEEQFQDKDVVEGEVNLPIARVKGLEGTGHCKGCGKRFRRCTYLNIYESAYYIHCIKECPRYQELGLIRKCERCNKLFLNDFARAGHKPAFCSGNKPAFCRRRRRRRRTRQ